MPEYPSKFDPRTSNLATPVESQYSQTCWAFAGAAALEHYFRQHHDIELDISERFIVNKAGVPPNSGGSISDINNALLKTSGIVDETIYPNYPWSTSTPPNDIETIDTYQLHTCELLRNITIDKIKEYITQYGGLWFGWGWSRRYTSANHAYYSPDRSVEPTVGSYTAAHAMCIVGWDDDFALSNFDCTYRPNPTTPGAILIKNSWGTKYEDGGYYWISYENIPDIAGGTYWKYITPAYTTRTSTFDTNPSHLFYNKTMYDTPESTIRGTFYTSPCNQDIYTITLSYIILPPLGDYSASDSLSLKIETYIYKNLNTTELSDLYGSANLYTSFATYTSSLGPVITLDIPDAPIPLNYNETLFTVTKLSIVSGHPYNIFYGIYTPNSPNDLSYYSQLNTIYSLTRSNRDMAVLYSSGILNESIYTVVVDCINPEGGSITVNPDTPYINGYSVAAGSSLTLTFEPYENYTINSLIVDGTTITPVVSSYTFPTISSNHQVHLTFTQISQEYKTVLLLQSHTNTVLDYQIPIIIYRSSGESTGNTVYVGTRCKSNFGDIRFKNDAGNILPYWIEARTSTYAVFWVKVDTIESTPTTVLYITYGDQSLTSASNGNDTFIFFDDFSNDLSKWYFPTTADEQGIEIIDVDHLPYPSYNGGRPYCKISYAKMASANSYPCNVAFRFRSAYASSNFLHIGFYNLASGPWYTYPWVSTTSIHGYFSFSGEGTGSVNTGYKNTFDSEIYTNLTPFYSEYTIEIQKTTGHTSYIRTNNSGITNTLIDRQSVILSPEETSIFVDSSSALQEIDHTLLRKCEPVEPTINYITPSILIDENLQTIYLSLDTDVGTVPFTVTLNMFISCIYLTDVTITFGDGDTYTTNIQYSDTMSHTYDTYGTYRIYVEGYDTTNQIHTTYADITVLENELICLFEIENYTIYGNMIDKDAQSNIISIINLSTHGNEFLWDFGDGTYCFDEHPPDHIYEQPGLYTITLHASNQAYYKQYSQSITIYNPIPSMTITITSE